MEALGLGEPDGLLTICPLHVDEPKLFMSSVFIHLLFLFPNIWHIKFVLVLLS
jgi:hypothetical protein